MRSTWRIETMVLPEPSRTIANTPRNTVMNSYILNKAKLWRSKFPYLRGTSYLFTLSWSRVWPINHLYHLSNIFVTSLWGNLERNFKDRFCRGKNLRKYDRDRDWSVETVGITGLRENSDRDGGIEEPYWGPSILALLLGHHHSQLVSHKICSHFAISWGFVYLVKQSRSLPHKAFHDDKTNL